MDEVFIHGIVVRARHGVYDDEKQVEQDFRFDVDILLDTTQCALNDDIGLTADYAKVASLVRTVASTTTFNTLEALCARICDAILEEFSVVKGVTVSCDKPAAQMPVPVEIAGVSVMRMRNN